MKNYPMSKMIGLFAVILCFGISQAWGANFYVDASATGVDVDGKSWTNAYIDLQSALAVAADGDTIHVAQGTYTPGGTRDDSFILAHSLTLLGGYPAGGGDRDPAVYGTVLSGTDNNYHVVRIHGMDKDVTMDGFTITHGKADGDPGNLLGGGMLVSGGGQVALGNVRFTYNVAKAGGGGLQFSGKSLTLTNVNFFANKTISGGGAGLHFSHGVLVMNHLYFDRNWAYGGGGGGLYLTGTSSLDMDDVTFIGNRSVGIVDPAIGRGGGICIDNVTALAPPALGTMTNVTLHNNLAYGNHSWGGGIFFGVNASSEYGPWNMFLTNVTLSGNRAEGEMSASGGGICIYAANTINPRNIYMSNVTLHGNQTIALEGVARGGGCLILNPANVFMLHVTVSGNTASGLTNDGGGVFATWDTNSYGQIKTDFRNSIFWGNVPNQLSGGQVSANYCIVEKGWDSGAYNTDADPKLGTLGYYGGLTPTIPLLEGSSAIDVATDTNMDSWWIPNADQRGELRPQGGARDIGAYEVSVGLEGILIDPSGPVPVNTEINSEAFFTDTLNDSNTYSATWDWGDGDSSQGVISKIYETVTGEHIYTEPGVYTVELEVSEANEDGSLEGLLKKAVYQYVVVYDPSDGFVTGGGWFNSQAGAYADDTSLVGEATFGFVSKYKKDATVPTGNTDFEFAAGDLYFHSTSYDWLVVTGSDYAKLKGSGTINGGGDYKFMLWAGDGETDTFRIRIWEEDEDTGKEIDIYDNGFDQTIGGGSIVIHAK